MNSEVVKTRRRPIWLALGVAVVAYAAYVMYARFAGDDAAYRAAREATKAIEQAVALSRKAQDRSREAQALLTEENFKTHRAELIEKSKAAADLSRQAAALYRQAAEKIDEAHAAARNDSARTYWQLRRKALERRADSAQFASEAYAIAADESILDYVKVLVRMQPITARAEAAQQDSMRYTTEADAYQETHKGKF